MNKIIWRGRSPDLLDGQIAYVLGDPAARDQGEARGLAVFRAHLGEHLGEGKAHGDRDPQLALDLALDVEGNRLVGGAQGTAQPREVGEGLVDGVLLHLGREAADDVVHPPRKEAVGLVVRGQNDEPRADLFRLVQGNAPLDPQGLGGVARAGHDPRSPPVMRGLPLSSGWIASSQDVKKASPSMCMMACSEDGGSALMGPWETFGFSPFSLPPPFIKEEDWGGFVFTANFRKFFSRTLFAFYQSLPCPKTARLSSP